MARHIQRRDFRKNSLVELFFLISIPSKGAEKNPNKKTRNRLESFS